jgi:hypothetical protein
VAKYGPEITAQDNLGFDVVGDHAASFSVKTASGSFVMNVTFLNGVAGLEKITNADSSHDISEEQMKAILASESAGFKWEKQSTVLKTDRSDVTSGTQQWVRSDGAIAICWVSGKLGLSHGWGEVDISSKEYAVAQRSLDQRDGAR